MSGKNNQAIGDSNFCLEACGVSFSLKCSHAYCGGVLGARRPFCPLLVIST